MRIGKMLTMGMCLLAPAMMMAQAPSLQEQLSAQYKVTKVGKITGTPTIVEAGTVLEVQKTGIAAFPPSSMRDCSSHYENGTIKEPGRLCTKVATRGQNPLYLAQGEKVYITKLEVNTEKDKVTVEVLECDTCNAVKEPSSYKAEVNFMFAKGTLANASAGQVEDTIGQLFAISGGK
jgi:hypothetical protein